MQGLNDLIGQIGAFAWGPIMIVLLVGTGVLLTFGTRIVQLRKLGYALKLLFSKSEDEDGDISPFQALMTSLAATIGTGNIAGVATAIVSGGPGAVFWMWITAIVGGATKFGEAVLAVKFRETNALGEKSGGPMYYLRNGMPKGLKWLGGAFAFFGVVASFGIGNGVQANSVAAAMNQRFGIAPFITGIILALLVGLVILGGIKRIGEVTEKLVPIMAVIYVLGSLVILFKNFDVIPEAFGMIFGYAFNANALAGGALGTVIRMGVARGVFSNEAGLGSAPIAHAAAKNNDPVKQGIIASLGSFIDTIIVCTMTALIILTGGIKGNIFTVENGVLNWMTDASGEVITGAALTIEAFKHGIPGLGGIIVSFGLVFFAFSTILGWFYYGSKCLEYLAGVKSVKYYKIIWVIIVFVGSITSIDLVWNLSDTFNGLMAIPNLIALLFLSPIIFKSLRDYESKKI